MHTRSKDTRDDEVRDSFDCTLLCPHDAIVSHFFRPDSYSPVTDGEKILREIRMTLKSIDWTPVSRKDITDLLGIVLAFTITRDDTTLFRTDHKFRWLERERER